MTALLIRLVGIALWLAAPLAFIDGRFGMALLLLLVGLVLLVSARLIASTATGRSAPRPAAGPAAPIELDDARLATVLRLLDTGRKIEAIRLVREASGAGLREAKAYVDALEGV